MCRKKNQSLKEGCRINYYKTYPCAGNQILEGSTIFRVCFVTIDHWIILRLIMECRVRKDLKVKNLGKVSPLGILKKTVLRMKSKRSRNKI